MDDLFKLLNHAVSSEIPTSKIRVYVHDPLRPLLESLEAEARKVGMKLTNDMTEVPSTSRDTDSSEIDSRICYASMLSELLLKLAEEMRKRNIATMDPSLLLSVQQVSVLKAAMEFFIPTAVSPYLDEGVGVPLNLRSKVVKFWKPLHDDRGFRKKQLRSAANVFFSLMDASSQAYSMFVSKFLNDIICINEQLIYWGDDEYKEHYELFLRTVSDRTKLLTEFFAIINGFSETKRQSNVPMWLKLAVGHRLTTGIMEKNGLYHLTTAIVESNSNYFENFTFVQKLARVIACKPQRVQGSHYYPNILEQFLFVLEEHPHAESVAVWFCTVLDAVPEIFSKRLFVKLLSPWEVLRKDIVGNHQFLRNRWDHNIDSSFKILSLYANSLPPRVKMKESMRIKKIFPLWLTLLGLTVNAQQKKSGIEKEEMQHGEFSKAIIALLKRIVKDESFEDDVERVSFLFGQLAVHSRGRMTMMLTFEKCYVVDVTEERRTGKARHYSNIILQCVPEDDTEISPLHVIVEGLLELLKNFDDLDEKKFFVDLLLRCVQVWKNGGDSEIGYCDLYATALNEMHFNNEDEYLMRVQYLMGRLVETLPSIDLTSAKSLASVLEVSNTILNSTSVKISCPKFDIISHTGYGDEELEIRTIEQKSLEMAVALVGAVVSCATENDELKDVLCTTVQSLNRFVLAVQKLPEIEKQAFVVLVKNALQLIEILKCLGFPVDLNTKAADTRVQFEKAIKTCSTFEKIMEDLNSTEEAMRGHALIALSKNIRKRDREVLKEIIGNQDIVEVVMKHVVDADSYVYLAAVRALTELAIWQNCYLDEMVNLFVNFDRIFDGPVEISGVSSTADEKAAYMITQRIKMGETLSKVFINLGELAPWHYDRIFPPLFALFQKAKDELEQTSILSALSNLILACRGRVFGKNINEMLWWVAELLRAKRKTILRRSAMVFLRAIITSNDIHILKGLGSELPDISRLLRQLLTNDSDDRIRLYAELCLTDIEEQIKESTSEFEQSHVRRIRMD